MEIAVKCSCCTITTGHAVCPLFRFPQTTQSFVFLVTLWSRSLDTVLHSLDCRYHSTQSKYVGDHKHNAKSKLFKRTQLVLHRSIAKTPKHFVVSVSPYQTTHPHAYYSVKPIEVVRKKYKYAFCHVRCMSLQLLALKSVIVVDNLFQL